jgi:ribosomal protein S6--L-glutamate ligase
MSSKKYLIVGGKCFETRRLLYELKQKGKDVRIISPEHLLMFVEDRAKGDCLYYTKNEKPQRIYKKDVAVVIPRIGKDLEIHAKAIKHIQNLGIAVTSPSDGLLTARDKMLTTLKLSENGIVTPKTILYRKPLHFSWIVEKLGGFPIIAKLLSGSRGVGVFILSDKLSASTALETISTLGHSLQLQAYVESSDKDTNKHDFRLIVINGKVVCCIKRFSLDGDFRSNASISKQAEKHEPSEAMKKLALEAAKAVGLDDCCGVDVVTRKEDGKMFVIEVNGNFGYLNAERFSKINVAKILAEYAIKISDDTAPSSSNQSMFSSVNSNSSDGLTDEKDDDEGIPFDRYTDKDTTGDNITEENYTPYKVANVSSKVAISTINNVRLSALSGYEENEIGKKAKSILQYYNNPKRESIENIDSQTHYRKIMPIHLVDIDYHSSVELRKEKRQWIKNHATSSNVLAKIENGNTFKALA